jgi:hypothetical protein
MSPALNGTPVRSNRLPALRRFAIAITILNVLGHFGLGFEQSWAQPLVALATTYSLEILLEAVAAWSERRTPHYSGGFGKLVDFLLPAHITGLAVAMLLYANDRLWPIAFAAAIGVGSKTLVRIPAGHGTRHCLNPSNTGIALTLLVFPWVGIAPPYQFTENLTGIGDLILPLVIVISGTFLNTRFTYKVPLILGWLGGFAVQALARSFLFGTPAAAALLPMTGLAFLLFTFYMVTDPGTTPSGAMGQFAFGVSVAAAYGMLMVLHVVFGLFFALLIVCSVRGLGLWILARRGDTVRRKEAVPVPLPVHAAVATVPALETAPR